MIKGWQTFSRKCRVGCGFVPAHAAYREVIFSLRIGSELPVGGSGPSGRIAEFGHGSFPRKCRAMFDKGMLPVVAFSVSALIDELLELFVADLILVEPIILQLHGREAAYANAAAGDSDHSGRNVFRRLKSENRDGETGVGNQSRFLWFEPLLRHPPAVMAVGNQSAWNGRLAQR